MIKYVSLEQLSLGKVKNLIYTINEKDNLEEFLRSNVISDENIPGAIPAYISKEGGQIKIRYHITKEVILGDYLKSNIGKNDLVNIINEFINIISLAEEKAININSYLLNINNVYIDIRTKEICLIYIPLLNDDNNVLDLKKYIKNILSNTIYNLNDNLYFFVSLNNYLNNDNCDIKDVLNYINTLKENININDDVKRQILKTKEDIDNNTFYENNDMEMKTGSIEIKSLDKNDIFKSNIKIEEVSESKEKPMAIHINTNNVNLENNNYYYDSYDNQNKKIEFLADEDKYETTLLDEEESDNTIYETEILDLQEDIEKTMPYLIREETREKFIINKNRIKVGREEKSCDFLITDNKLIGRIHAIIIKQGSNYFIEDNNSTNGTFINSIKLSKMGKGRINHQDKIKLANEIFIFKLY